MPKAATAFVEFQGDFSQIRAQTKTQAAGLEKSFGSTFKNIAKAAAVSFAAVGVGRLLKSSFKEAEEAQKVDKQTAAVLKSTGGVAKVSAKDVDKLASSLSKKSAVDDEVIKSGENVLLTFTNIKNNAGKGNDVFDQGTEAALNMSAALGTDLQGSVIQVGKALNDPVKGMTALRRVGVSFTKAQEKQVKALVASGKTLDAQKLILKELTTEFGGAAAAAATPSERLKVAVGNLQESIGRLLLPVVEKISTALAGFAEWLERNRGVAIVLGGALAVLATAFVGILIVNKIASAVKAFRAAMVVLNASFLANPVVLVVLAIAALGAAIFIAYKKFGPFRDAVDKVWQALQDGFRWVQRNWPLLLAILTGPFGLAIKFILDKFDGPKGLLEFVKKLPGRITAALVGIWDGLTEGLAASFGVVERAFGTGVNAVIKIINGLIRAYNNTLGRIPGAPNIGTINPVTFGITPPKAADMGIGAGGVPNSIRKLALKPGDKDFIGPVRAAAAQGAPTVDARTVVMGNVYGDSHLRKILDDHDRELEQSLAVA